MRNFNREKQFIKKIRRFYNDSGSITVEASIALPTAIILILSFFMTARLFFISSCIQDALYITASELSEVSYFLEMRNQLLKEYKGSEPVNQLLISRLESVSQSVYSQVEQEVLSGKSSSGSIVVAGGFEPGGKSELEILKLLLGRTEDGEFSQEDRKWLLKEIFQKRLNNKVFEHQGLMGVFIKTDNRAFIEKLDFDESQIWDEKGEVKVIVKYGINSILPLPILPEIRLKQKVYVRTRSSKTQGLNLEATFLRSLWQLENPLQRGKLITYLEQQQIFGRVDIILEVRSMDLRSSTYKSASNVMSELKSNIQSFANKISQMTEAEKKDKSPLFRVIVPEETLIGLPMEQQKELKTYALNLGIGFEIFERYGK